LAAEHEYYETLGVSKTASADEIRRAYRKLALKYHPDKNKGDRKAERKFREIADAYEVLRDPERRKTYDRRGRAGLEDMGFRGFGSAEDIFSAFGDIFMDGLGGSFGRRIYAKRARAPQPGRDLVADVTVTFLEAVEGTKRSLKLQRDRSCPECGGTGDRSGRPRVSCPACGGSGQSMRSGREFGGFVSLSQACAACGGTGQKPGELCGECGGSGVVAGRATLDVKVPKGVRTGQVLRLAGQGEPGKRGGPAGDLLLTVRVEPHPELTREGRHVRAKARVPFTTAMLGGKVPVPTIKGKAKLTVPPGTQPGDVLRMGGLGISDGGSAPGDELVEIEVELPKELTPEQKELAERLREKLEEKPEREA
jgi:molecular chaperone DnaJ